VLIDMYIARVFIPRSLLFPLLASLDTIT
jgi:hypothetical protein